MISLSRRRVLASFPAVLFTSVLTQDRTNDYSPLPIPKFSPGQQVKTWYDLENFAELVEATGTVKGLCWQPQGWRIKVGWVYQIYFPPDGLLESNYYWDDIPEFDPRTDVASDSLTQSISKTYGKCSGTKTNC